MDTQEQILQEILEEVEKFGFNFRLLLDKVNPSDNTSRLESLQLALVHQITQEQVIKYQAALDELEQTFRPLMMFGTNSVRVKAEIALMQLAEAVSILELFSSASPPGTELERVEVPLTTLMNTNFSQLKDYKLEADGDNGQPVHENSDYFKVNGYLHDRFLGVS